MLRRIKTDWAKLARCQPLENPFHEPKPELQDSDEISVKAFPEFIQRIGLIGMGGSGFNTAQKLRVCHGAHTLIINGVECEPGITIDQSVLLYQALWVKAGANASAKSVGAQRIVLAVKNNKEEIRKLRKIYSDYEILPCPDQYPAGAEKLIIKKLEGKMPPPGTRPYQQGYLVQNVVSLRAIGRALLDGIPVVERPLTLTMPSQQFYKNIIAPVNILIWEVLEQYQLPYDPAKHIIVSSGLMMGCEVSAEDCVDKITTSLIILEREELETNERDCIRCGACNSACPLGLHPFTLTEAVKKNQTEQPTVEVQLNECFLCGACSAVCPSDIPLVQTLMEGKRCLR